MKRELIKDLQDHVDKEVTCRLRVLNTRKLGKISFLLAQDYSGTIQVISEGDLGECGIGDAIEVVGTVKADTRSKSGYELHAKKIEVLSKSEPFPFDFGSNQLNLNLATLLDNRPLDLRHPSIQPIFRLYSLILESYAQAMRDEGFVEIKTPKILESASEGGANFFTLDYFGKKAVLAQSPQFYKQIMVGVYERVFEIGTVFRAEPHFTSRHVNEYTSLDAEIGFINSYADVTAMLNKTLVKMFNFINEHGSNDLEVMGIPKLEIPEKIPSIKLAEAKKIIKEKYGHEVPKDTDIDPAGERFIGQYAKEEFGSDFIFVTHYPWSDRPFYTMPSKEDPTETYGFDLLFKGCEIVTGSQRIHRIEQLEENMKKKKVSPKNMEFYVDIFKYGMPPHGGWGMGSERVLQQILGLASIKEVILFPRDINRLTP
jgi:nondiscriminating aspartyl-tRNA synthetase